MSSYTPAYQQCPDCGSPLRPCICDRDLGRPAPGSTLRTKKELRTRSFSNMFDGRGDRYGVLFLAIREMRCWLWVENYYGPGHECCTKGVQDSPNSQHPEGATAHHVGRFDEQGLIPGCGAAHDLYKGLGGRTTIQRFRAWLDENGINLQEVALGYVEAAKEIV